LKWARLSVESSGVNGLGKTGAEKGVGVMVTVGVLVALPVEVGVKVMVGV